MKTKYFIYARKSTEDEERQVKSIEDQLKELKEFSKREKLQVAQTFIENKSAKKPGRPVFNEMIQKLYKSDEPIGLLAWHPDRLARNSVDGGHIIYLIDIKKVTSLKFPTFWFEPTPQGLFMLQVSFGQSKYYSDNLSENVSRGLRQKVKRGEWPSIAPFGYINNPKTRNIEPYPLKAKLIKTAFEEFATGNYSLESLRNYLYFLGLTTKKGTVLAKSVVRIILSNPIYLGLIRFNGELYEGKFKPIIEKELWDKVQVELKRRSRPRNRKDGHYFPFTGLLKCGECGCMITAQYAKQRKFIYYRCTKKNKTRKCNQPYISDISMLRQLKDFLNRIAIPSEWAEIMLSELDRIKNEDVKGRKGQTHYFKNQIREIDKRLNKLINAYLDSTINKKVFVQKKEELLIEKVGVQEKMNRIAKKGDAWVGCVRDFIENAFYAGRLAVSDNLPEIKQFIKNAGENRHILDRKVINIPKPPFDIVVKYRSEQSKKTDDVDIHKSKQTIKTYKKQEDARLSLALLNEVIVYFHQKVMGCIKM